MKRMLPVVAVLFVAGSLMFGAAQEPGKTPIPDKTAQAKAHKLLLDIFADDIEKATTADAKTKLAAHLFGQGKEAKDDAAVRYVCYKEAGELAAKGGDVNLALAIAEETSRVFAVDPLAMKADLLGIAVVSASDKETGLTLVEAIKPLLTEAIDLDNYKAAHQLGESIIAAAKKAKSPSLVLELQKRVDEIKGIEKNFARLQGFLDRVEKNPGDAEAQLELAKYFAYQKKRWEKALPYFAKCGDKDLEALARKDQADPKEAADQLAVADGWWERAGKEKGGPKVAIQMRAMFWYDKAMPSLTGLNRTKAQKRIDIVQDQLAGTTVTPTVPIAGPVGEFRKFEGHNEEIKGVALSHDGRYAASGSRDQTVRLWDLTAKSNKEAHVIRGHTKEVWGVTFHPNNRSLFSVSWDGTARLWDIKNGNELKRWTHPKDVNGIALSRDASTMLTGCDDEKVHLWNVSTGEEMRQFVGHSNYVYAVAFAPDGKHIASGGVDKTVRIFNLQTAQLVKTFDGHNESVTNVAFTSDSRHVLSSGDSTIHIWDVATGKELPRRFEGHSGRIPAMAISPDGRRLLTGGDDRTVKLWDVATGKMLHSFAGHNDTVTCVAFSHDGRRAVSGSYDKTVRVWNLPGR
ncbi:MAG TPA: WD40 repeat domain-containing protein [Gemmataceae bacterium]|nr:WD40 repeat domain-containing protein [Gemmataceae bacterium]